MQLNSPVLVGKHVRLEPLDRRHIDGLVEASAVDPSLYKLSPVPQGKAAATTYVNTAIAWRDAGIAVPFATVRLADGLVIGSTRFFDLERWAWPKGHPRYGRTIPDGTMLDETVPDGTMPDACEIGYTWLTSLAIRSAANTESKLLMLTHAFEQWQVLRVCLHTDARNERSRTAIERIGAKFEGILRSHRMAADYIARDSFRYSIVAAEWPDVKKRLRQLLGQV
jgi:N-acetyltransferase